MESDPQGHYRALGLTASASAAEIAAAFRARARLLHPDVPGTGDIAAFQRVNEAHRVLGNALRRAAYDRAAAQAARSRRAATDAQQDHRARAEARMAATPDAIPPPPMRWPRFGDLPWPVWAVLAALLVLAVVQTLRGVIPASHGTGAVSPAPALAAPPVAASVPAAPPLRLAGPATDYVLPAADAARVWRRRRDGALTLLGSLAAFTSVSVADPTPWQGLLGVRLAGGGIGFIAAERLYPGSLADAEAAACAYRAGAPPRNAEVLRVRGGPRTSGPGAALTLANPDAHAAVVVLDGPGVALAIYLDPAGQAELLHLPPGTYRARVAHGAMWSRACGRFIAGMQAEALAAPLRLVAGAAFRLDLAALPVGTAVAENRFLDGLR
ncbi:MAG: DnaJ domain-containing protein [Rhodospirillales bacterium]|nr:DnaJ domain-containing protein [Rhodospirillales bacterium]